MSGPKVTILDYDNDSDGYQPLTMPPGYRMVPEWMVQWWIPCKNELPPMGLQVLTLFDDGFISLGQRIEFYDGFEVWDGGEPVAWMRLPPVPQDLKDYVKGEANERDG